MGFEKRIELVEHHARADAYRTIVDIEIVDLAIVPREIDDQPVADRVPDQTRAGAAWCDRNIFVRGGADDRAGFVGAARKRHANWLDLINRRIGRVELARQIVESNIAIRIGDGLSLRRGHLGFPTFVLPEELQDAEVRAPVMADEMLRWQGGVNIKVKTKIRFNGQEYSDPNQLPPEVRAAYDKALSSGVANQRIIINGQEFT